MVLSFRGLFVTFALIGVFVFSMLSFAVTLQVQNDVNDSILNNTAINKTFVRLEGNLSQYGDKTQEQRESFESEIPERGFGSLIIFSIVSLGQKFTAMIISVYNVLIVLPASILGIPSSVIGVFTAILTVTLILLAWRVYRVGG